MSEPLPPGAEEEDEPLPPGAEEADEPDVPGLESQPTASASDALTADPNASFSVAPGAEANPAQATDPYAGYAGYDPNAAGYDYSAYWAHYGYPQSAYYPGQFFF